MPVPDDLPLQRLTSPLRIRSRLLDDFLWILPDWYEGPRPSGVCYSVNECLCLLRRPDPCWLRAVHAVKGALDGELDPCGFS